MPQTITAWAYSWVGSGEVRSRALPVSLFYDLDARRRFLEPLVEAVLEARVLTGHNIIRFDLPVLQADIMRTGLPLLEPVLVQDTIRVPKSKGFKKGQDVMSQLLKVEAEKIPLNWQQWMDAYADPFLENVTARVESDVRQHLQLREAMRQRGWLMAPRMWKP